MNKLIIIAGASGVGKTYLFNAMNRIGKNIMPIKKLSTRPARDNEKKHSDVDLDFDCPKETIKKECDYIYQYGEHVYGVHKNKINDALKDGYYPFVIVRDCNTIKDIKKDFNGRTITLYLQSIFSGSDLAKKLIDKGRSDIDAVLRNGRSLSDCTQYQKNINEFDAVLLNDFEEQTLIDQLSDIINSDRLKDKTIRNEIFVIMPFAQRHNKIYLSMESAIEEFNKSYEKKLLIHRIDKGHGRYNITEKIIKKINEAEIIICDLTDERQNVYYELGYATVLNKKTLLIARNDAKIYFDVAGDNISRYTSEKSVKNIIQKFLVDYYEFEKPLSEALR